MTLKYPTDRNQYDAQEGEGWRYGRRFNAEYIIVGWVVSTPERERIQARLQSAKSALEMETDSDLHFLIMALDCAASQLIVGTMVWRGDFCAARGKA